MSEYVTQEEAEIIAIALDKLTQVVKKHDVEIKTGTLGSLTRITEIKAIDFEVEDSPVSQINRLLKEGWKLIALNQYTRPCNEEQKWGSVAYLGLFK